MAANLPAYSANPARIQADLVTTALYYHIIPMNITNI